MFSAARPPLSRKPRHLTALFRPFLAFLPKVIFGCGQPAVLEPCCLINRSHMAYAVVGIGNDALELIDAPYEAYSDRNDPAFGVPRQIIREGEPLYFKP